MSSSSVNPPPGLIPFVNADHIVKTINPDGDEIRRFADQNVQASMDRVLAGLHEGEKIAFIATPELTSTYARVSGAVMLRMGKDWSFVTAAHKDFTGNKDWGVQSTFRWSHQ